MDSSIEAVLTANGDTIAKVTDSKPKNIVTRPAHFSDYVEVGRVAAETYVDDPLTNFLSPHRAQYLSDYERGFVQRAMKRMLDPRNLTMVAYDGENANVIFGYAQLYRFGDDEGAQQQIRRRSRWWLLPMTWVYWVWCKLVKRMLGDGSTDENAARHFMELAAATEERHWKGVAQEERKCRWHVQSLAVRPQFQGMGVGRKLVGEVTRRAEREGVVVGLEASEQGEKLYRKCGFELLGRFDPNFPDAKKDVGGVMMWVPEALKGKKTR
jgi:ribosomal protein S18 acetylase RimI-like enzyme